MNHERNEDPVGVADDPMSDGGDAARTMDGIYNAARVARDKLNAVLNDMGSTAEQADKHVRRGVAHTETKIKDHPLAAVTIAAGLGIVIGLLLNRRH